MSENSGDALNSFQAGGWRESFPYVSPWTSFHELQVAEFSPLIELDASNGLSPVYRDKIGTPTGSGAATETNAGEILLSTGTTSGSEQVLATQERGRYQPGIVGLPGQAIRIEGTFTDGAEAWWEYGDGEDGMRIGQDSSGNGTDGAGRFVQFIHNGIVDDRIYQGEWNGDNLTGEGGDINPSSETLDFQEMQTYRMPFVDYGGGPGEVQVKLTNGDGRSYKIRMHTFPAASQSKFFANPKLPLRQYVSNGSSTNDIKLYVGGRQFAVLGRYNPNRRQTTALTNGEVGIDSTPRPILVFRKKQLRKWQSRSVKVSGVGLPSDIDGQFEIVIGGDINNTVNWEDIERVSPDETALELFRAGGADTGVTLTGGTRVDGGPLVGGSGNRFNLNGIRELGLDIPDDTIVSIVAQTNSGTGAVFGTFSVEEEA